MAKKEVKQLKGVSKVKNKFVNASRGIYTALREESSLIVYLVAIIFVVGIGIWVSGDSADGLLDLNGWVMLLITMGVVIGFEFVNTSIENFVDLLSFEYNIKAKKIKDIGAAASIINVVIAIVVGFLVLLPPLITKINGYFS